MNFSSLEFLFGFAVVFFALYALCRGTALRNYLLLAGSIVFYAWGDPFFVVLLLASCVANWAVGLAIEQAQGPSRARWMYFGVAANLSLLATFKYAGFMVRALDGALGLHLAVPRLPLPLGISFYTFMAVAYLVDISRGTHHAERSPIVFGAYLAAFPKIMAGPIARYSTIGPQMADRRQSLPDVASSLRRFIIGLAKKVLIANNVAYVATTLSGFPAAQLGAAGTWLMVIAFTLQIYFDFSGYTDMALGVAGMLGFRYPENFDYPYTAASVSDFWRRWHMSLTSFFREYVYIPLGGNRVSTPRWVFNVLVVWALTGLWHGANWNFILWGAYFGVVMVLERFFLARVLERVGGVLRRVYTMLLVMIGWVMFMSPDLATIGGRLLALTGASGAGSLSTLVLARVIQPLYLAALLAGIVGSLPWWRGLAVRVREGRVLGVAFDALLVSVFVLSVVMIAANSFQPFLYVEF